MLSNRMKAHRLSCTHQPSGDGATVRLGLQEYHTFRINCDTEDDGEFWVPSEALSFLDPGTTSIHLDVELWNSSELNPDEDGEITVTATTVNNSVARAGGSP